MPTQRKRWGIRGVSTLLSAAAGAFAGSELGPPGAVIGGVAGGLTGAIKQDPFGEEVMLFLLWQAGVAPSNYPHFLDYAAEHILLRKVGGGYMFVHQLLLDYFASLDISNFNNISSTTD